MSEKEKYKLEQLRLETQVQKTIFGTQQLHTIYKGNQAVLRATSKFEIEAWLAANAEIQGQVANPNLIKQAVLHALVSIRRTK